MLLSVRPATRVILIGWENTEAVKTVRETQQAERVKQVELVQASQHAEREAIALTVAAEAEKQALWGRTGHRLVVVLRILHALGRRLRVGIRGCGPHHR